MVIRYLRAALYAALLLHSCHSGVRASPFSHMLDHALRNDAIAVASKGKALSDIEPRNPPNSYKDGVKKGKALWKLVRNPDPKLTNAANWRYGDLAAWGWSEIGGPATQNVPAFEDKTGGLEEPLKILQIGPESCRSVLTRHNATDASYFSLHSPSKGTIIVFDRHSPNYFRTKGNPNQLKDKPMPRLSHWSDITFLTWMKYTTQTPSAQRAPVQYIFIRGITNPKTQEIVSDALAKMGYHGGKVLPQWPGYKLVAPQGTQNEKTNEPFLAILGTENFGGVVYLLAQHVGFLGRREIEYIQVWGDGGKSEIVHAMVRVREGNA